MQHQSSCDSLRPGHRIHNRGTKGDVQHEPAIHDVDMDAIRAGFIDRANLLTESPQIGRQNRGGDNDRPHRASNGRAGVRCKMNRSIALANPSSSLEEVTRKACACTSGLAFPIAMLRPLLRNISTSFGMSPIVAISMAGTDRSFDRVVTTVPLLALGWVTSR